MKNLLGLLLLCGLFTFASCGGDDDCTTDSFVGSYTGEIDCDGIAASGTLTITKVSETEILLNDGDGGEFTIEVTDCTGTYSESAGGLGSTTLTITLDGDKLNYSQDAEVFGLTVSCSGTLDRN